MAEVICNGIDVSYHQAKIDWNKVKTSGVKFAILRAGLGKSTIDKQFIRNITECNRLEIPVGVYWFSYALNTEQAAGEAAACLKAITPGLFCLRSRKPDTMPVCTRTRII